jgi:HD-GYP domain-containing protein (c-di-GMP phosphodiesterase class II)
MHLSTQEIPVQNLEVGMYVSRLDVPWVQTPFPIQGFHITKQEQLEQLALYCNKVYVDRFLSKVDVKSTLSLTPRNNKEQAQLDTKTTRLMNEKARFKPAVEDYKISVKLRKEVKKADLLYNQINGKMSIIFKDMMQNGYINFSEIRDASSEMVKSVLRNPDAMAWMCRISSDNQALHEQAVRSALWGIIFGRHLGLSRKDLKDIGTALLLAPIGKCKLPRELLFGELTNEETLIYQGHINLTLEETEKMFSNNHQVNYILSSYCERNNGTGYPRNLVGNRIPFLARVVGIAQYYEELINPLPGREPLTPVEAISNLYNERGNLFQIEMIESFIQAIGIYPTGSLVKLTNGSVGVVMEQPVNARLRPRIVVIKDAMNVHLLKPKIVSLAENPTDRYGMPLQIEKSLKSTSLDIDSNELHQRLFVKNNWLSFLKVS